MRVVLRIAVDESKSKCKFNVKFGMSPVAANLTQVFETVKRLNQKAELVQPVGVSFHVGSGCESAGS